MQVSNIYMGWTERPFRKVDFKILKNVFVFFILFFFHFLSSVPFPPPTSLRSHSKNTPQKRHFHMFYAYNLDFFFLLFLWSYPILSLCFFFLFNGTMGIQPFGRQLQYNVIYNTTFSRVLTIKRENVAITYYFYIPGGQHILLLNNQNLTVTFSLLSFFFFKKIHAVKCYHKLERGAREGLDLFLRLPPGESYYCVRLGGVWKTIHKKYKLVSLFFLCLHRWISIVSQLQQPPPFLIEGRFLCLSISFVIFKVS